MKTNLHITKPRYSQQILPVPLPFVISRFHCRWLHHHNSPGFQLRFYSMKQSLTPTTDEHRGGYWRKQRPWTIVKEQFPVPRNKAASKIGNGVISLQWQLRCRCNTDHDKFSSLSDTAVVVISKSVNGDVVYVQTWGALIPKNSHRATLIWNCIPLSIKYLIKIRLKLN